MSFTITEIATAVVVGIGITILIWAFEFFQRWMEEVPQPPCRGTAKKGEGDASTTNVRRAGP